MVIHIIVHINSMQNIPTKYLNLYAIWRVLLRALILELKLHHVILLLNFIIRIIEGLNCPSTDLFFKTDSIWDLVTNQDPPNNRTYDQNTNLGTWTSFSSADSFLNNFNHFNGYKNGNISLAIGNKINIQDGTYNATWVIARFDLEHKQVAADGSVYDNGYCIALIPYELIKDIAQAQYHSGSDLAGGYLHSSIHTIEIPAMVNKIANILGNHIVERNVLLSSSNTGTSSDSWGPSNRISNSYTWTTAKATLMSVGQLTGTFGSNRNSYDDGEATYKLPLFDHASMSYGYNGKDSRPDRTLPNPYWLRNIKGAYKSGSGSAKQADVSGQCYCLLAFKAYI